MSKKETLTVSYLIVSNQQRTAFVEVARLFEQAYPQVRVEYVTYQDAEYKEFLDATLNSRSEVVADVLHWQAGERLRGYAVL